MDTSVSSARRQQGEQTVAALAGVVSLGSVTLCHTSSLSRHYKCRVFYGTRYKIIDFLTISMLLIVRNAADDDDDDNDDVIDTLHHKLVWMPGSTLLHV